MSVPSVTWAAHPTPADSVRGQRVLVTSEETPGLKSLLWDPARGAVLAKKEEKSWRYLSGPAHGESRPTGPCSPPGIQDCLLPAGPLPPHICYGSRRSWPIMLYAFPF